MWFCATSSFMIKFAALPPLAVDSNGYRTCLPLYSCFGHVITVGWSTSPIADWFALRSVARNFGDSFLWSNLGAPANRTEGRYQAYLRNRSPARLVSSKNVGSLYQIRAWHSFPMIAEKCYHWSLKTTWGRFENQWLCQFTRKVVSSAVTTTDISLVYITSIILHWLSSPRKGRARENQAGFQSGRGCIDEICDEFGKISALHLNARFLSSLKWRRY